MGNFHILTLGKQVRRSKTLAQHLSGGVSNRRNSFVCHFQLCAHQLDIVKYGRCIARPRRNAVGNCEIFKISIKIINLQVGFNGGNGTGWTALPYSGEGRVIKLMEFSNVAVPGRWIYRVDEQIIPGGCSNESIGM